MRVAIVGTGGVAVRHLGVLRSMSGARAGVDRGLTVDGGGLEVGVGLEGDDRLEVEADGRLGSEADSRSEVGGDWHFDVEVVGHASSDARRAEAQAARWGGRGFADVEAMLDATSPDAVWVCVTPDRHGALERSLLARQIPFFVEKPLSADLATAEQIAALVASQPQLVTAVGYKFRALDTLPRVRSLLAETPARMVLAAWHDALPPPAWWRQAERSGGQVVEQATHLLDLARVLLGAGSVPSAEAGSGPSAGSARPPEPGSVLSGEAGSRPSAGSVLSGEAGPALSAETASSLSGGAGSQQSAEPGSVRAAEGGSGHSVGSRLSAQTGLGHSAHSRQLAVSVLSAEARRWPRADAPDADVADVTTAHLRFHTADGPVPAVLSATCLLRGRQAIHLQLVCEGRVLTLSERSLVVETGQVREEFASTSDPFAVEDAAFLAAIAARAPSRVLCTYADALESHRLACAIRDATEAGRVSR